jgi:hypothetical protein
MINKFKIYLNLHGGVSGVIKAGQKLINFLPKILQNFAKKFVNF